MRLIKIEAFSKVNCGTQDLPVELIRPVTLVGNFFQQSITKVGLGDVNVFLLIGFCQLGIRQQRRPERFCIGE